MTSTISIFRLSKSQFTSGRTDEEAKYRIKSSNRFQPEVTWLVREAYKTRTMHCDPDQPNLDSSLQPHVIPDRARYVPHGLILFCKGLKVEIIHFLFIA